MSASHRTLFVGHVAVVRLRSKAHGRDTRRVHHTPHALFPRRFQQRTRALDIRPIHFGWITHPQSIVGRDMKHDIAARKRLLNRSRIAQVASHPICIQSFKVAQIAGWTNQQT
jgi:hypothetical protein